MDTLEGAAGVVDNPRAKADRHEEAVPASGGLVDCVWCFWLVFLFRSRLVGGLGSVLSLGMRGLWIEVFKGG